MRGGLRREKILCSLGKGSYIARLRISGVSRGSRPERIFLSPQLNRCGGLFWTGNANDQSTCAKRTTEGVGEIEVTGSYRLSAEARGLWSGNHADAEEAEFCPAQGGESAVDQRPGSDCLHSGRGSQSAGTLDRAGARWPGRGFAGRALPYCPWDARFPRG